MNDYSNLNYIIHHVFLPSKLPQKDDDEATKSTILIEKLLAALKFFQSHIEERKRSEWTPCIEMISSMLESRDRLGGLVAEKLESKLEVLKGGDILALFIRGQNAGLIIRRLLDQYSFESFEVSPTNEAVIGAKGRLRRCFPGPAASIGRDRITDAGFRKALAELIVHLDAETPEEVLPLTKKARSNVVEIRDTVSPRMVTEMLTAILRAIGRPLHVPRLYKRTRDDVLWKGALRPWRRSPLWLLLRIALQTTLLRYNLEDNSHLRYKSFMMFFMACILSDALKASLPSDVLFTMMAKISRRALKLGKVDQEVGLVYTEKIVKMVQQELTRRWNAVIINPSSSKMKQQWEPSKLSFLLDTRLTLSSLQPYLNERTNRMVVRSDYRGFAAGCFPRIALCSSILPELDLPEKFTKGDNGLILADLEVWVQDYLNDWVGANIDDENTCTALAKIIDSYTSAAAAAYEGKPEETSLMLLVTMELWIALDKCTVHHCHLLSDYDPEFSLSLFEPLLLPKRQQLERLFRIEQYLVTRKQASNHRVPSIFQYIGTKMDFAVRYFEQSLLHKELRRKIEAEAEDKRSRKLKELAEKRRQYDQLMQRSNALTCQYVSVQRRHREVSYHSNSCQKCELKSRAQALTIDVHEHPLPERGLELKAVIFELCVPDMISKWRDATFSIFVDVFTPRQGTKGQQDVYTLHSYAGLTNHVKSKAGRLQLASTAKSFTISHYRYKSVSQANENNICVNNGLRYSVYDIKAQKLTQDLLNHCDVREKCTLKVPLGAYQKLQYAVTSTTHTSNEVIANQAQCPKSMSMHEFYAFATLRSGHHLQWRNIARELTAQVLDFSRVETYILVAQAIWQAGPLSERTICRESHLDLEEREFGSTLLSVLDDALTSIEGNWQGAVAARIFIALVTRVLSLSSYAMIHETCFRVLRRIRQVTHQWTRDLNQKLQEGQKDEECIVWTMRTLEMALTCHETFNVDRHHLDRLLDFEEDFATMIECSILIHDRCPKEVNGLPSSVKSLLDRHRRLSHLLEPIIRKNVLLLQGGLNRAVGWLWAGYKPGTSWTALDVPNERWLSTETCREGSFSSMIVHYNILSGSLLVNGSSLAGLPQSYQVHPNYRRLFGEKVLDVITSRMDGMAFETRNEFSDHQIYFSMHESELIVRAKKDNKIYELLPLPALEDDFPQAFIQGHAHWLELVSGVVEWRPITNAWVYSSQNWQMQPSSQHHQGGYVLTRGTSKLVDIRSLTAKGVLSVFSPLEHATHIHITFDEDTGVLDLNLPRLKLDFFKRKDNSCFESKQFRGMFVDTNQSFGTLTGLDSKLVLRGCHDSLRSVIIPHGNVIYRPDGHHVRVQIDTTSLRHVSYHLYHIDYQLGRLIDNGSLKSRLFRCYLHALTAHCLTDELTSRTGTEEALSGLAAASTRSFLRLEQAEADQLKVLAQLTPKRQYYPRHLQVMQEVQWATLSPLSQHSSFFKLVKSVFKQAKTFHLFQNEVLQFSDANTATNEYLLERAAIRDSTYRVQYFGAEDHTTDHDVFYLSRDQVSQNIRESQTFHTARLVDCWSVNLKGCSNLLHEIESWSKPLHNLQTSHDNSLSYDKKWLDQPPNFLPTDFCALKKALSRSTVEEDKYRVMMILSTMAYSKYAKQELVQTLLAFATIPALRALQLPNYPLFTLSRGYAPNRDELISMTEARTREYDLCPESRLAQLLDETWANAEKRRKDEHRKAKEERIRVFVEFLIRQWPGVNISAPINTDYSTYISLNEALKDAQERFHVWNVNSEFRNFVKRAQVGLDTLTPGDHHLQPYTFLQPPDCYTPKRTYISFDNITNEFTPIVSPPRFNNLDLLAVRQSEGPRDHSKFGSLLTHLSSEPLGNYERQYINDLRSSFNSLQEDTVFELTDSPERLQQRLEEHLRRCEKYVDEVYRDICHYLRAETSTICRVVYEAELGPRMSPTSLLPHLAQDKIAGLRSDWRRVFVGYGMAISALQHAKRLYASIENITELLSELRNPGHDCWDPMDYPDWLLLEIENNISIRPVQAIIALEMITPSSHANSIMQLNMGEGKSSIIVPIVAATLADRKRLVRVVVLKELTTQMFQLLVKRLGGMLDRRIFYMPFSRSLRLEVHQAIQIRELYEECMRVGAILLVQPEHLLSFELIGPERLLSGNSELGIVLIETQQWLEQNSRDVLDESDEILSVRFELIYTIGTQRAIEFGPSRWLIIEHVLGLVGRFAEKVNEQYPNGLTLQHRTGRFPRIRILESLAGEKLMNMVTEEVCDSGLPEVPVQNLPQGIRGILFSLLTDTTLSEADNALLQEDVFNVEFMRSSLLLLKGLIGGGILTFALANKRWRVNYGLDLSRTMLAVPYRAKDSPATRAEFSHPDVTMALTCLSYYYGGLSDEQLYISFEKLLLSDNANEEYEQWVEDAPELQPEFRKLVGVNLSDSIQCSQHVFPILRFAKKIVDFYLSKVVFPTEMKEFPHKMATSGWDIARSKAHPTTGFSGTNDSKYILPLSINQCDLPQQLHTNATQLDCLLRSENSFINSTKVSNREVLDAESLLYLAVTSRPSVRVILDVGAQVLELQNKEVARAWLKRTPVSDAQAVAFFDKHNELTILSRDGITEPLMVSHFANIMDQCLVYLDEAHTRGTDLQLPTNYRAIVTLGPNLTKDRLVQACMRMRKLGKGQSVMFCGPKEVEDRILECSGKACKDTIMVEDVLKWSISETHQSTRKSIPLWVTQGIRQQRRFRVWSRSANHEDKAFWLAIAKSLLETEVQTLQDRYGAKKESEEQFLQRLMSDDSLVARREQISAIQDKSRSFQLPSTASGSLQEEQERELSPENEMERQIERPLSMVPHKHSVHPDMKLFIRLGKLNRLSNAFQPAFETFHNTSAFRLLESNAWPAGLLVTTDFARTVRADNQRLDSYLRPVHWVASSRKDEYVILSPYEANELMPVFREHKVVTLHLYSPRINKSMRTLDDLSFCAVPALSEPPSIPPVITHLNLFAGQLYLRSYDEYLSLCRFLGLCSHAPGDRGRVSIDGFIRPSDRVVFDAGMAEECTFKDSPVEFLRALMGMRRKEQSYRWSHLGRILHGERLNAEQF